VTDENGTARFTTIYPGWYQGRAVHIHFKIRDSPESEQGYEFTSQLYFDDALTDGTADWLWQAAEAADDDVVARTASGS
jgi:protocatechuate 3,4-dioxygenase beta subunit